MSVNYYLDSPSNDAGHLGKSGNAYFIGKAAEGVNSFADWVSAMQGHRIFAEHGIEYTAEEMAALALERHPHTHSRRPRYEQGEFMDRGVLFVRHEFC